MAMTGATGCGFSPKPIANLLGKRSGFSLQSDQDSLLKAISVLLCKRSLWACPGHQ
jgi:hypothetical protein